MKFQNKLTNGNDAKGFAFVEANAGGDKAFIYIKAFSPDSGIFNYVC